MVCLRYGVRQISCCFVWNRYPFWLIVAGGCRCYGIYAEMQWNIELIVAIVCGWGYVSEFMEIAVDMTG